MKPLKFELASNKIKKSKCPKCQTGEFQHYINLPKEYGKCERINECGYHKNPYDEPLDIQNQLLGNINNSMNQTPPKQTIYPTKEQLKVFENLNSNFIKFCTDNLKIPIDHLKRWAVGTDNNNNTCFGLIDITGKYLNIKSIKFKELQNDIKRNRTKLPFYLKSKNNNEVYKTCLYGEKLLEENKIICLVESEKTAVISAFFYPQYNWLATGGANGLTVEKVQILISNKIYYLEDNDNAGKNNSSIEKLKKYNVKFDIVTFETAKQGEDLADLIIRGERPKIEVRKNPKNINTQKKNLPFFKEQYNKETNEINGVTINYTGFIEVLYNLGYRRFDLNTKEYIFIKIEKKIITEVTTTQIQDVFIDFVKKLKLEDYLKNLIIEKFFKSIATYFNSKVLSLLKHTEDFAFNKDTKDEAFVYFKNGFVRVNKENWELVDYSELNGYIWQNQIINKNFDYINMYERTSENLPVFAQFMFNISGNKERFFALCSIVGYNLHNFFETKLKATILTDSSITEEAEGRTGKTLLADSLKYIKPYKEIPGKTFDITDKYKYSKCEINTQIMHLNDVKAYFDFECLYNDITEGITVDKKNQHPFSLKVKILISTNKTIKINGASSRDRCIEFELAERYNDKYQPKDDFKHWFFRDWDEKQWNEFYNFMMYCLSIYFSHGLIQAEQINLSKRKLLDETCAEFVEWISTKEIKPNEKYSRNDWQNDFLNAYPDLKENRYTKTMKTFTKYLTCYCQHSEKFKPISKDDLKRTNGINTVIFRQK